jgi:hypothetical protein
MSLKEYLDRFRNAIEKLEIYGFSESIVIQEEIRAGKQAVLFAEVVLIDASRLVVREYIDAKYELDRISYADQYHTSDGSLIFRYDNAKHKPDLGFTEHRHDADGTIKECQPPEIHELLDEVIECL